MIQLPPDIWRLILRINKRQFSNEFFSQRRAMLKQMFERRTFHIQTYGLDMYLIVCEFRDVVPHFTISLTVNSMYVQTRIQNDLVFEWTTEGNQVSIRRCIDIFRLY